MWGDYVHRPSINYMKGSTDELPAGSLDELAHIPLDDALDALNHIHRRKLLIALLDHNPHDYSPAVLADSENDDDALDYLVAMNHVHLPKLVEYGFIDRNRDTHEVIKGPNFDEIEPLLQLLADNADELTEGWL